MTRAMKRSIRLAVVSTIVCTAFLAGALGLVAAQGRQGLRAGGSGAAEDAIVSPAEIQRMFDSYALMQAQEQLKIGDDRFPQFLIRFKALQDVRRRGLNERARAVQELRRLVNDPQPDEAAMRERAAYSCVTKTEFGSLSSSTSSGFSPMTRTS